MSSSNIGDLWHSLRREVGVDFGQTFGGPLAGGGTMDRNTEAVSAPEESRVASTD